MSTIPSTPGRPAIAHPIRRHGRWLIPLTLALLLVGGLTLYIRRGAELSDRALAAYIADDCTTVHGLSAELGQQYALPGLGFVQAVAPAAATCATLGEASRSAEAEEYAAAVAAYDAFLTAQGATPLAPRARAERTETIFAWGASQRASGLYGEALQTYALLADDASAGRRDEASAETYAEWGSAELGAGKREDGILRWQTLLAEHPDSAAAVDAPATIAAAYADWTAGLFAAEEFEALLRVYEQQLAWAESRGDGALLAATQLGKAHAYLAWSTAQIQQRDFDNAWTNNLLAANHDPDPAATGGPAAQAIAVRPELLRDWAERLVEQQRHPEALGKLREAQNLLAPTETELIAAINDELATTYLDFASAQSDKGLFRGALSAIDDAATRATSDETRAAVEESRAATIDTFSRSQLDQATDALGAAVIGVCGESSLPSVPNFGLADAERRVVFFGDGVGDANEQLEAADLYARSPAELHFVACATQESRLVERCDYDVGYQVHRYRDYLSVVVRAVPSGRVVERQTFSGTAPAACEFIETFTIGQNVKTKYGDAVSLEEVTAWLRGIVQ